VCGKGLNDEQAAIMAPAISNARIVNLADNLLGAIPQLLPKGLEALDVSKNAIASLPLLSAPTLRELYLGGNGLER
jgi:Leucine-rich repeat (LRR) protein